MSTEKKEGHGMESIVSTTSDGGLIITWEKDGREAYIVLPEDREVVYYAARNQGERMSAGCVEKHEAVENLWRWVVGDSWCATGLIEAAP
jgi:hypothetical protein